MFSGGAQPVCPHGMTPGLPILEPGLSLVFTLGCERQDRLLLVACAPSPLQNQPSLYGAGPANQQMQQVGSQLGVHIQQATSWAWLPLC